MIRWIYDPAEYSGGVMPQFAIVSLQEAEFRTIPGRQGKFLNGYVDYIQQLPDGKAGKLRIGENENHAPVRRRLNVAAQTLGTTLKVRRAEKTSISGEKIGEMSSRGVSAIIPEETDEGGLVTTFPHSHSLSRNWVSKEYQRKSPRS
jgi:hypothetical protein